MEYIVGIDLGTCYSAVALPQARSEKHFYTSPICPDCAVICDPFGNRITPSVLAEDSSGNLLVGHRAKNRAGFSPEPIMFSKRWLGTDKTFQLKRLGTKTPVDAATEVLRYLKQMAEERLGGPLKAAVITVPAYFDLRARQLTREAAKNAGLEVADIALEPVAAATAYCVQDPRESLRILTYDLGGGTFDVAVLEKREGVISTQSNRSFDGNPYLGGYNFDASLAAWMLDRLIEQHYDLKLDVERVPEDRVIFAKLMVLAERAKIALSKHEWTDITEPNTGITDHSGNPVAIELQISRQEFEDLIRKRIESTMDLCHRALEKADPPLSPKDIDEIVMVGGSSRIPLIARLLEDKFGIVPKLVDPDLSVAIGAALLARGSARRAVECFEIENIPKISELEDIRVAGVVRPAEAGCVVRLSSGDGAIDQKREVDGEGNFEFNDVRLACDAERHFTLKATNTGGQLVGTHLFTVRHTSGSSPQNERPNVPHSNLLPKPISIQFASGEQIIFPERTPIPSETRLVAVTADRSGRVVVPILEGHTPLGEIVMADIPDTVAVGTDVEVVLEVTAELEVRVRAYVRELARDATVVCRLPVKVLRSLDELRREFEQLTLQADAAVRTGDTVVLLSEGRGARLKMLVEETETALHSRMPDSAGIQDQIEQIESLIRVINEGWRPQPPRAVFDKCSEEAGRLLRQLLDQRPEYAKDGHEKRLEAIRIEAERAYGDQHSAGWKTAVEKLFRERSEIEAILAKDQPARPAPTPTDRAMQYGQALVSLRDSLTPDEQKRFAAEFDEAQRALRSIDVKAHDASARLSDWYASKYSPLADAINARGSRGVVDRKQ